MIKVKWIVALGGGVVQNRLILEGVKAHCEEAGFRVIHPQRVPANDGGIALGQVECPARVEGGFT